MSVQFKVKDSITLVRAACVRELLAHLSGSGGQTKMKKILVNFLTISGDSKHFSFFPNKN